MSTTSKRAAKFGAIVSAALLMGLYVYDRAGGRIIECVFGGGSVEQEPAAMPSSKVKRMFPVEGTLKNDLLPGSKYVPIELGTTRSREDPFNSPIPMESPEMETPATPSPAAKPLERPANAPPPVMFHGSKSAVLIPPSQPAQQAAPAESALPQPPYGPRSPLPPPPHDR